MTSKNLTTTKPVQVALTGIRTRLRFTDIGVLILLALALFTLHMLTNSQYGFHRDELALLDNARHLDWLFSRAVVVDALVALEVNWMADYRNAAGFAIQDGKYGATITLEDSPRVDPWIVGQALRAASACRQALVGFSRLDRATSDG